MGEFIKVNIDWSRCLGVSACGECIRVCPVNIFGKEENRLVIIEANDDECTLCDLCMSACSPDAINIIKLYDR